MAAFNRSPFLFKQMKRGSFVCWDRTKKKRWIYSFTTKNVCVGRLSHCATAKLWIHFNYNDFNRLSWLPAWQKRRINPRLHCPIRTRFIDSYLSTSADSQRHHKHNQRISQFLHAHMFLFNYSGKLNGIFIILLNAHRHRSFSPPFFWIRAPNAKMSTQLLRSEQLHHLASSIRSVEHLGQLNLNFLFFVRICCTSFCRWRLRWLCSHGFDLNYGKHTLPLSTLLLCFTIVIIYVLFFRLNCPHENRHGDH